ncbi:tRNA methyltransferase complex GCD14 subunit-domain-containing protein [Polychytrium aggregatum]|uniref:tRNA methyltransferase complex GCD14 subunit-domain-containing protein n=1 Tax=Polychytrium aggregatum TaxID=110093 RepID=UPI0022FE9688|nr:tRNA methyltransferase complex GCD14 subunit-domain-containing protein [Polychytrium aggregatum]KAI9206172.1 tRNA methyltransferase complex GCD14 subunit-domain-containing protein [Polychytrium aggregatum]
MSFLTFNREIQLGDKVLCYMGPESMCILTMSQEGSLQNRFGEFKHQDMIGQKWGTKMPSKTGRGFIYLLQPSPELWTLCLPHRTQILYMPDISFVSTFLQLKPGVKMIESGTGSGSFSHSIARSIAPSGHLFTFEYHEERAAKATKEFADHQLEHLVTVECRDVCKDGFGIQNRVTAVFLDLPAPWEAIASAKAAFKSNRIGRLCSFSPCIEQVQQTCKALAEHGFNDIRMMEVLIRPHEVHSVVASLLPDMRPVSVGVKRKEMDDPDEPSASKLDESKSSLDENSEPKLLGDDGAKKSERNSKDALVSRITKEVRGHTSYLTFATLYPSADSVSSSEPQ